jgi:archaeal type IV pilus assembly protein PilA
MNVFGKRERRWRKGRKRGVSPIIATILLVAITVVLAAVLYVLISGLTKGPGTTPLGTAFAMGAAQAITGTSSTPACVSGDSCYSLTVESAGGGITAGSINFKVVYSTNSTTYQTGNVVGKGISIVSIAGLVVATGGTVAVTTALTLTTWTSGSTVGLSSTQTIWVDLGTAASHVGQGLQLQALGVGSYQGTVSATLP